MAVHNFRDLYSSPIETHHHFQADKLFSQIKSQFSSCRLMCEWFLSTFAFLYLLLDNENEPHSLLARPFCGGQCQKSGQKPADHLRQRKGMQTLAQDHAQPAHPLRQKR